MFIDSIRALLRRGGAPEAPREESPNRRTDSTQLAACALLLEIAHADGEFATAEREHLERVLATHFSLGPDAAAELLRLAEAERSTSIDHHRFTALLRGGYDDDQKMVLAESMWGLVLSDGDIADREHYLTRKIANLLDLQPAQLSAAKAAAAARARAE